MTAGEDHKFDVLPASLQISFYAKLKSIRELYLDKALGDTVKEISTEAIDQDLHNLVARSSLDQVASFGVRGECVFPVPCLLQHKPRLLGYYRLLYGLSQKDFYSKGGFGKFKRMEEEGVLTDAARLSLPGLCTSLIQTAQQLVTGLDELSTDIVHELQILTYGAQLRGSRNTALGQNATRAVYDLIADIVRRYIIKGRSDPSLIQLTNDSNRVVSIRFASDPDVRITEKLETGEQPRLAIEIKGGTDYSNIHNRLGEAEKSHLKARNAGFNECWTVLGVELDEIKAKRGSPTSTQFYNLEKIRLKDTDDHKRFRVQLAALLGLRTDH